MSLVIPHHGDLAPLAECLESLAKCSDLDRVETLVVINGAAHVPRAFRAEHPTVRFLHEPEPGAAHARNAGVAAATGETLVFVDSDCTVAPDLLTNAMTAATKADVLGGDVKPIVPANTTLTPAQAFETVFAFDQADYIQRKGFSVTACLVTQQSVFKAVGGFRHGVSEDLDWCRRATAHGFTLAYAPELSVYHPCRDNWHALRAKWRRLTSETYALRDGSRLSWVAKACLMPVSILAHTPKVLATRKLSGPRERAAAWVMLARLRLWRMAEMLRLGLQSRA